MGAGNRKYFFAAAMAALLILSVAMVLSISTEPLLLLFDGDGRKVAALPLEGGGFVHRYIHSIHKTPVDEEFIVSGRKLELIRLRYDSYGVGMPSDAGEAFRIEDNRFVIDLHRTFDRLDIRVSNVSGHGVLADGVFHDFTEWVPAEYVITLKAGTRITFFSRRKAHL